jgi:propanol-preferring alcohol dehydrogenase
MERISMTIPKTMRAMILEGQKESLMERIVPVPRPGPDQILVKIHACGVCRTDLHIIDGDLQSPKLPLIPGHEIVGTLIHVGEHVKNFRSGDKVGVPWLGYTDGSCNYCRSGRENLCNHALFTGYTVDGGYAEYTVADYRYCFHIPKGYSDAKAAPLMCAGLIGYRSYRMAMAEQDIESLGIFGFGAAAHIITQVAVYMRKKVYAFTRPGDIVAQNFARRLGAVWAGDSTDRPPEELDAAIVFAPIGSLVPAALGAVAKGGTIVCGGIHMTDIPSFAYRLLWEERIIRSVANLTREDGWRFLEIAPQVPVKTEVQTFPLERANEALEDLRRGNIQGAAVLTMG